ncbi:MAG TPA: pseudaminic acid synthase [Candidatus Omnitrophica bacterium]|nr:pseudaminic acid synthase [Candidatus Omnitrophota bacterium]
MEIKIGRRTIGGDNRVFIIAELSANHRGDYGVAKRTIRAMKDAGADAVKFQTYTPDTITLNCDARHFRIKHGTLWDGKTFYKLYKEAMTPWSWQPKLKKYAEAIGLICFSSPFDKSSVDFLEKMRVPAYKIASFEITDIPLIEYVASKGKPVIISTGIAALQDIREALRACRRMGNNQVSLLKCTSAYPAPFDEANLRTIPDIARRFKVVAGLSDHTSGISLPVAAVALGARIIEKHFILDRKLGGPDAAFSLEPQEFADMSAAIRDVEAALGGVNYNLSPKMLKNRIFSRSLFTVRGISAGECFTEDNIRSIRPGLGLPPKHLKTIIGKKARINLKRGTPLALRHVSK